LDGGSARRKATTYTYNTYAYDNTNTEQTVIYVSSGIPTHEPSVREGEDSSCPRLLSWILTKDFHNMAQESMVPNCELVCVDTNVPKYEVSLLAVFLSAAFRLGTVSVRCLHRPDVCLADRCSLPVVQLCVKLVAPAAWTVR
jgi:hypothetical protein